MYDFLISIVFSFPFGDILYGNFHFKFPFQIFVTYFVFSNFNPNFEIDFFFNFFPFPMANFFQNSKTKIFNSISKMFFSKFFISIFS
jgi:hypothetical protein